ncbi:hypothetical protein U713_01675 [Rhodobacter capsulatus YW2]|nr:hypothetical protein U713_01675 [Rhodobacter capsulatus YW2]
MTDRAPITGLIEGRICAKKKLSVFSWIKYALIAGGVCAKTGIG